MSELQPTANQKLLDFGCTWKGGCPASVFTNAGRFRQLLMNVVGNAVKFTENGRVRIVACYNSSSEESKLIIEVIDSGIGISPARIEKIFEPFVQIDDSVSKEFGGTGLGLAVSRRLADELGGELRINSSLGIGTRVTIEIAAGSSHGVEILPKPTDLDSPERTVLESRLREFDLHKLGLSEAEASHDVCEGVRILLVEDGVANRKLVALMLADAGAIVTPAENGLVGVELAQETPFDLILMDMQMPVMGGYTATTKLREMGLDIPIVALTAHAMDDDEDKCRAAGCSGYLTKPINSAELLNSIKQALNGYEYELAGVPIKPAIPAILEPS